MSDLQPTRSRSFAMIADDLATWMETIEMLDLQIAQAGPLDDVEQMRKDRAELAAAVDTLGGELAKKADGVVAVLKRFKAEAQLIADEEMRLTARRLRLEKTKEWLQDYVIDTLDRLGTDFLKTPTATIRAQKNGGIAPLMTDPGKLATEWLDVTVKMPHPVMRRLMEVLEANGRVDILHLATSIKQVALEASNGRIRAALGERCESCAGAGKLLTEDVEGKRVEVTCEMCEGTGTRQIPGAKLEPRGRHLRLS